MNKLEEKVFEVEVEVHDLIDYLSERLDNASFVIRAIVYVIKQFIYTLVGIKVKVRCPKCNEFSRLVFDENVKKFICSKCEQILF